MPDWREFAEDDGNRAPPLTLRPFSSQLSLRQTWGGPATCTARVGMGACNIFQQISDFNFRKCEGAP